MELTESDLDNELMAQKNKLLELANSEPCELTGPMGQYKYRQALGFLDFSKELWSAANYGYKAIEILNRIIAQCETKRLGLHHRAVAQERELTNVRWACNNLIKWFNENKKF